MKGHKGNRKHREEGGVVDKDDAPSDVYAGKGSNVEKEAEERKKGGRVARKTGGVVHREKMEHLKHAHHVAMVHGEASKQHAGRKPRKAGGACESHLFSAAAKGEKPAGHSMMKD